MITHLFKPERRWLVPEVVQTSAMDCGPASLNSLLEGFGISASYGRLREACQTDVDGTSIDTLEEVANQLGLEAEQIMIPADHVLLSEAQALPAIAVVRQPNGLTHFVVVWRRLGSLVQLMDPATGRRWLSERSFLDQLYVHILPVPAAAWRDWAGSDGFLAPLRRRLADLGLAGTTIETLIRTTLDDPGWRPLAALDAATRMVAAIVRSGGLQRGQQAARVLATIFEQAQNDLPDQTQPIPAAYWSVRPAGPPLSGTIPEGEEEQLLLRGVVLMRVQGRRFAEASPVAGDNAPDQKKPPLRSSELAAVLTESPSQPGRELLRLLRADGLLTPLALLSALCLAGGSVVIEALLFRGLLNIGSLLAPSSQRLGAISTILLFMVALLFIRLQVKSSALRLGRRLEARLRLAFLAKIPRLHDRYFQSRLMSDMAERSHSVHFLRELPALGAKLIELVFTLMLTTAGIAWLDPASTVLAGLTALLVVSLPLAAQPLLTERDLRVRTHRGGLGRFYLDALLGLVTIRTHGAEQAIRHEHESLLVDWRQASLGLLRSVVLVEGVQMALGFGLATWLLVQYLVREGETGGILLLVYWALQLPFLGQEIALLARQYPMQRNITLRLLEPLGAPEAGSELQQSHSTPAPGSKEFRATPGSSSSVDSAMSPSTRGAAIGLADVAVRAGGHTILEDINLTINPGEHVAIVGPSGAGKSSLVGLLLGWHRPAQGQVLVDGYPLDERYLHLLRRQIAWVDPTVQLWNRSLLDNLNYGQYPAYGSSNAPALSIDTVIEQLDLLNLLQKLPEGLQQPLGESGALVSGGEGQRVRLGRAILRSNTRLVILDEPFRGLDREKRRTLLSRARQLWQEATLLCITHDVGQTQNFERVVVVEAGRIVEDGSPAELAAQPDSRYTALLRAETALREGLWSSSEWRRWWLEGGQLAERPQQLLAEWKVPGKENVGSFLGRVVE